MGDVPQHLDLKRHRDLAGRSWGPPVRRVFLALLVVPPVLGLLGVFGQEPQRGSADASAARLTVTAPRALRGGLIYQVRIIRSRAGDAVSLKTMTRPAHRAMPASRSETACRGVRTPVPA